MTNSAARTRATLVVALAALAGCSGVATQLSPLGEELDKQTAAKEPATVRAGSVACWESEEGDSRYLAVKSAQAGDRLERFDTNGWQWKQEYSANVTIAERDVDPLREYGLIIYANGQWLVPQEPGR